MTRISIALISALLFAGCRTQARNGTPTSVSFLRTEGLHIVNADDERVALRGFNLGSWLLLEPWMVKLNNQPGILSEKDIWDQIEQRFGADKMRALVAAHRERFITESDIEHLRQLGVNFVRLPIWWRVLGDTHYDPDGWQYVDRLLDWCEQRDIYVMIDLHGAPGGQNDGDNILGERNSGAYWGDNPKHRQATIALWRKIATRYRDRAIVAGYDLLNEAWGAPTVNELVAHTDEIYRTVREIDSRHIIFIGDGLKGYYRLPHPADKGWQNVVYTFHFYPENGVQFPQRDLAGVRAAQLQYGVPVNIGEFNIPTASRGGISVLERSLQVFNAYGWSWNLWSYRVAEDNADWFWGLTGFVSHSLPGISLATSSYDDIRNYLTSPPTSENELLRTCVARRTKDVPVISTVADAILLAQNLHVEWQWTPPNLGFWRDGESAAWTVTTPQDGHYQLTLTYAVASNPPTACVFVDGVAVTTSSLPVTRGWMDYEHGLLPCGFLNAGRHVIRIASGGLNVREARLSSAAATAVSSDLIVLTPAEIVAFRRTGHICVEWQNAPPNVGHWNQGDGLVFRFHNARAGVFAPALEWSAMKGSARLRFVVNGRNAGQMQLPATGGWHKYEWQQAAERIKLPAGNVELIIIADEIENPEGAGNLRTVKLNRES